MVPCSQALLYSLAHRHGIAEQQAIVTNLSNSPTLPIWCHVEQECFNHRGQDVEQLGNPRTRTAEKGTRRDTTKDMTFRATYQSSCPGPWLKPGWMCWLYSRRYSPTQVLWYLSLAIPRFNFSTLFWRPNRTHVSSFMSRTIGKTNRSDASGALSMAASPRSNPQVAHACTYLGTAAASPQSGVTVG